MKKIKYWIGLILVLTLCATTQAEMIAVGGDQTAETGTLTINQDIIFTVNAVPSDVSLIFVFDEIVTADDAYTKVSFSGLEFSVNGGARRSLESWVDNLTITMGDMTPNDGYIYLDELVTLAVDDKVTLHAGTGTMTEAKADFNPWASGDYNMYLLDGDGNQISDVVPEPATAGLLGISAMVFYAIRRIKNFNRPV